MYQIKEVLNSVQKQLKLNNVNNENTNSDPCNLYLLSSSRERNVTGICKKLSCKEKEIIFKS